LLSKEGEIAMGLVHRHVSRREMLKTALFSGAALATPGLALAQQCQETPRQDEGPFYLNGYDRTRPVTHSNDLTVVPGATGLPQGRIIHVTGRVTDADCRPVKGAMVEIWQANARGRYVHVADPSPVPKDPNFLGFGEAITDDNGMYSFKTIKPGAYPVPGGWIRPPHVHFKVHGGFFHMMVTQMYFAGEEHNRNDFLLSSIPEAEQKRLVIEPSRRPGGTTDDLFVFDIALKPFRART
jgi:protocatechuate 3,4-dioxygenase beta subunit